jgi:hypothetical protein
MAAASSLARSTGLRASLPADAAATVQSLAAATRAEYHDPKLAEAVAQRLLDALKAGRFPIDNAEQFTNQLNAEITAASHDAHFVVMAGEMGDARPVPPTDPHAATPPLNARELDYLKQRNFGIGSVETLRGNIGRLAIRDQFYRPTAEVRRRFATAMSLLADTRGLIIDLTGTIGGDPHTVAHVLSYYFDRPSFVINRFRWRKTGVEEFRTTSELDGPKYGEQRPVAVLVSNSSFSAAEEFAYDMQVLKRGIVVGVKTPGAANHALPVPIAGGFTAFIPKARAENPVTLTNWEGVGVAPDVPADPPTVEAARAAIVARL